MLCRGLDVELSESFLGMLPFAGKAAVHIRVISKIAFLRFI